MRTPENILVLIERYLTGKVTAEEKKLLDEWYHSFNDSEVQLTAGENESEVQLAERIKTRLYETLRSENEPVENVKRRKWLLPAAAAAILLLLSAGAYLLFSSKNQQPQQQQTAKTNPVIDILPGGNKAILTLADNTSIVLDSASNGTLSLQGNIQVQKLDNGMIAYVLNGRQITEKEEAFYNTISTPRGGQYHVTLTDGTEVWLNASSSIRFPVVFTGTERKVEITGEAYLEVAKNPKMPFKVKAASSEIEVMGTHFNINAYNDEESIKTTLVEGMVKVSAGTSAGLHESKILKPGQQSGISKEGRVKIVENADIEEALAWKNGRFQFKSADLKTILRQISRWYDADIVYKGNVNLHFTGHLPRDQNVSKVFEMLALTGEVHFAVEGKKIIVSP